MATADDIGKLDRCLARRIEAYWLERGFKVACHQVTDPCGTAQQANIPGLRSNMVDGQP